MISIEERRLDRSRSSCGPAAFFFALGCPFSYLATERVERTLGQLEWVPVLERTAAEAASPGPDHLEERLARAAAQAKALRLPLLTGEHAGLRTRAAGRAAVRAAQLGAGRSFALAAGRMAFCGGFDLDEPEVLGEAAVAVGLEPAAILAAAADDGLDGVLDATTDGLRRRGITTTPAVRLGERWFSGLDAVPGAMHFATGGADLTPAS